MGPTDSVSGRRNGFTPIRCILFMAAAAVVVFALLSVMSSSDSEANDVAYSGTSGEVTWTFDPDTGKLEFSGSGKIPDAYRNCSYKHLAGSVKSVVIGDSVTSVGAAAFQDCTGLTSVTIGNSVTSIGYFAFEKCKLLTSVFIPDSVTFIGYGVFKNCESLSTITVGSGNTSFCIIDGVLYNKNVTTLITCPSDKAGVTLKIPSTVTKLEPYSFSNCGSLKNLNIPDTVTDIGGWAFQYVHPDRIIIPKYLDYISPHAFCNHEDIDDHYMDAREDPDFDGIRFIDIWGYLVNYNTRDGLMDLSRFRGFVFEKRTDWVFYGKDTYTVTFTDYDGNFVYTARYIEGDTSVIEPANSSDYGYVYTWPEYTLGKENIDVREVRTPVEYTVSFDANGGTGTMDSVKTNVELFSEPENKFGIPEEHMHFDGWSLTPGGEKIDFDNFKLDNVTLYARWAWDQYKITFNVEGSVYEEMSVDYGDIMPVPPMFVKIMPRMYIVTKCEWDGYGDYMFMPACDLEFNAVLTKVFDQYNVKFVSEGNIIKEYTADYSSVITLPENPVKDADSRYTYTFASWEGYAEGMTVPARDLTFAAQFTNTPVQYKVKFVSDGNIVKEYTADYGSEITLPDTPSKASDSRYTYAFASWEGYAEGMTVPDHDIEFTAQFTNTPVKHEVKFVSGEETVSRYDAEYSSVITLPDTPVKVSDSKYTYAFASWEGYAEGMTVPDHDLEFTAEFTSTPIKYTVKFVAGETVTEDDVDYGSTIILPENPVKESDSKYTYTFASWKDYVEGMTVPDHDIEFTAQFTSTPVKHEVKFVSGEETVSRYDAEYSSVITLPDTPVKASDSKYAYAFASWEGYTDGMTVPDHDIEFTAQFTNTPIKYIVRFVSEGIVVDEHKADYSSTIVLPATPVKAADSKYSYTFASWEGYAEGMTVPDHDLEFTVQFTNTPVKYNVKFVSEGNIVSGYAADYRSVITLPDTPVKVSDSKYTYAFASWEGYAEGMTVPDHDLEFTAEFTSTPIKYTVKFVSEGIVVGEHNVDYGSIITLPESPSKASDSEYTYTFASWKGYTEGMTVPDSDITFEAQFTAAEIPHEPVTPETPEGTTTVIEETNIDDGSSKITISSSESSVVTVVEKPKDGIVSAESSAEVTTVIVPDSIVTEAVSKLMEASDKYGAEEKAVVIESDKNELTLSSAALDSVVDAGASTEFRGEAGTLKFSKEATGTLASSGEEITLSVSSAGDSVPMGSHKMRISNGSVFALKVSAGESAVSSFAGTVTVTLPYVLSEGKTASDVSVYHINDSGEFAAVKSSYNASSQTVTFVTNQFSYWAVTDSELQPAEEDHTVSTAILAVITVFICIAAIMICVKRVESE